VKECFATVHEWLLAIHIDGLSPDNARLLAQTLADAVEGLSDRKAEPIGAPEMALRH
jgi:hypothetical protein